MGPQATTAHGWSNAYFRSMATRRINNPTPTTNAAIRNRVSAARTFFDGAPAGRAAGVVGLAPATDPAATSGPVGLVSIGSGGTSAVPLGEFGQRSVVRGQFRVFAVIISDVGDRHDHP